MTRAATLRALSIVALAISACGVVACNSPRPKGGPTAVTSGTAEPAVDSPKPMGPVGRIRGVVTLRGTPPEAQSGPISKDQNVCGSAAPLTRLALGHDNLVRQAFVYLDGVPSTEQARPRLATQVEQKGCAYGPHVMTLATGADLEIVNSDPILHNIHAKEATPDGLLTVFNIAQPIQGQRTKVESPLNKPGIIALTCEAGHPWMTAYILVTDNPYVATTNDDGTFVIDNVPVGAYPIKMWHEGVRLTRMIPSLQQYEYEEPYELTRNVTVAQDSEAVVNFDLELRPAPRP